jgi:hypothetical protein
VEIEIQIIKRLSLQNLVVNEKSPDQPIVILEPIQSPTELPPVLQHQIGKLLTNCARKTTRELEKHPAQLQISFKLQTTEKGRKKKHQQYLKKA